MQHRYRSPEYKILLSCRASRIHGQRRHHEAPGVCCYCCCFRGLLPSLCWLTVWDSGSSVTAQGLRASAQSWCHLPARSSWRWRINPPFLHCRACSTVKQSLHPSQRVGRCCGSSPQRRSKLSRNSSAESTVPFKLWGMAVSQAPVCWDRFIGRATAGGAAARIGARESVVSYY